MLVREVTGTIDSDGAIIPTQAEVTDAVASEPRMRVFPDEAAPWADVAAAPAAPDDAAGASLAQTGAATTRAPRFVPG